MGIILQDILYGIWSDNKATAGPAPQGLRPVFDLISTVKITGGDGSENNPYTLGV